jgi:Protein of unknown function (DUF3659)
MVQRAILNSGGYFSVITDSSSATGFVDVALANGLTYNDNPQGYNGTLFAGLSTSRLLKSGQSSVIMYDARNSEDLDWTISTYNISKLDVVATLGGKTVETTSVTSDSFDSLGSGGFFVSAPKTGQVQIKITAGSLLNGETEGMVVVGVTSNMPFDNCTLTIGALPTTNSRGGLTARTKAGIAFGVIGIVGLFVAAMYFLFKCWPKGRGPHTGHQPHHPPVIEKGPINTVQAIPPYPPQSDQTPPESPPTVSQPMYPPNSTYSIPPTFPPQTQAPPAQPEQHPNDQHNDASGSDMSGSEESGTEDEKNPGQQQNPNNQQDPSHHHKLKVKRVKRKKKKTDILEGKVITPSGLVVDDSDPDPNKHKALGRLVSGNLAFLVGWRCAKKGQVLDQQGNVVGQCEVLPKEGEDGEASGHNAGKRGSFEKTEYESWGHAVARTGVKTGVEEAAKAAARHTGLTDRIGDAITAAL